MCVVNILNNVCILVFVSNFKAFVTANILAGSREWISVRSVMPWEWGKDHVSCSMLSLLHVEPCGAAQAVSLSLHLRLPVGWAVTTSFLDNSASGKDQRCWLHRKKQVRLSVVSLALHSGKDENIFFMQATVLPRSPPCKEWGQSSALHIRWIPGTSCQEPDLVMMDLHHLLLF